jgi:putative sterol carrier protein
MVQETRPPPKIAAVQATQQIPQDELLDVGIRVFDPGIPADKADDEEALAKLRIYPELRKAEARFLPTQLRQTLETSAQWGAVRVVPDIAEFVDVLVTGTIVQSSGKYLALDITARDSAGRIWIANKRYESVADIGAYKTEAAMKARDPFQNVFSLIANDLVAARDKLTAADRSDVHRLTSLRFARDLAPEAVGEFATKDAKTDVLKVTRLPAAEDPFVQRVERIRERDDAVTDTVNGYYANFADSMRAGYGSWRQTSLEEIEKEERARSSARLRTGLGAAAVLASIFVPDQCRPDDYQCRNVQSAARTAGTVGGVAAVLSGIKKFSDARIHAQALKEVSQSFEAEVAPQVIDVEGRTLRLTGSAEDQYREWRKLLREIYLQDAGGAAPATPPAAQ